MHVLHDHLYIKCNSPCFHMLCVWRCTYYHTVLFGTALMCRLHISRGGPWIHKPILFDRLLNMEENYEAEILRSMAV